MNFASTAGASGEVLVTDLDGAISYASPAVTDFGYTPDDMVGMRLDELVHPEDLSMALREFYLRRGYWGDLLPTYEIALAAARQAGNPEREAEAHRYLGASMSRLGRLEEARTQLGQALRLAQELDDAESQGQSHFQLALICGSENDYRRAMAHCGLAGRLARACRHVADEAYAVNATGLFHARLGDLGLARAHSEQALRLHRRAGSSMCESLALQLLGCLEFADGRYRRALLATGGWLD